MGYLNYYPSSLCTSSLPSFLSAYITASELFLYLALPSPQIIFNFQDVLLERGERREERETAMCERDTPIGMLPLTRPQLGS